MGSDLRRALRPAQLLETSVDTLGEWTQSALESQYRKFTIMKGRGFFEWRMEAETSIEEAIIIVQAWEFKLGESEDVETVDIAKHM